MSGKILKEKIFPILHHIGHQMQGYPPYSKSRHMTLLDWYSYQLVAKMPNMLQYGALALLIL